MIRITGIKITDRIKEAGLVQEIISKYSSLITTRLGFHELTNEICSREAFIILHLNCEPDEAGRLASDLRSVGGIDVAEMDFYDRTEVKSTCVDPVTVIFGLLVEKDHDTVIAVQKLLTSYGCNIKARLGVNESFFGKPAGLIILEAAGDKAQLQLFEKDLRMLKNVHFRKMEFC